MTPLVDSKSPSRKSRGSHAATNKGHHVIQDRANNAISPWKRRPEGRIPLSYAQERLWFLHQLDPESPAYNVFKCIRSSNPPDLDALQRSLDFIVQRHESLRTNFSAEEGQPTQVIAAERAIRPKIIDLRGSDLTKREQLLQEHLDEEIRKPFDLTRDSLLRVLVVRMGPDEQVLLLTMHHIISDGWSLNILFREFITLYAFFLAHPDDDPEGDYPLASLPVQFADYALWERSPAATNAVERSLAYWRNELSGGVPALELPTDHPQPAVPTNKGASESLMLPRELSEQIHRIGRTEGGTPFTVLLAAFQTLLYRYTGQSALAVGTCVAGRSHVELESLIGFFVNTLVIKGDLSGDPSFRDVLHRTREATLGALAHQDVPFDRLVQELRPERHPGRNPFFEVMFTLQAKEDSSWLQAGRGRRIQLLELGNDTAKFDLTLSIVETDDAFQTNIEYRTDLFEASTIERMLRHYQTLLEGIVANLDTPVALLPLLTAAERQQILVTWNQTACYFPETATVNALFEQRAIQTPDAIALAMGNRVMRYSELNGRANRLAHRLRKLGVGPDVLVAVCMPRSFELIVALLGVLKSGGAYVAIDPGYPPDRITFMLKDAQVPVILTLSSVIKTMEADFDRITAKTPTIALDADWPSIAVESPLDPKPVATGNNLAYVAYTSGSTGTPKGACIEHRAINRLVVNTNYLSIGPDDVIAHMANCSFDASTFEIWGPLINGARIAVLPPELPLTPEAFGAALRKEGVNTLFLTTALFLQLARQEPAMFGSLQNLLVGGESLHPDAVRAVIKAGPPKRFLNVYGPTECTTFASFHELREVQKNTQSIPIGRPISNTTFYILDQSSQAVPIGVPGELYIGGSGLARGYLRRPEEETFRFVPNPFGKNTDDRLYRTGDRARWRSDGSVEFLGRFDLQVKIRGHRIEPEEIEAILERHPAVAQCAVVPMEFNHDTRLVAYVVSPNNRHSDDEELRHFLRQTLPVYMIPAHFVFVSAFPINKNGKIDRRSLPPPDFSSESSQRKPVSPAEVKLAGLWESTLGIPNIPVDANFFELGGHSLAGAMLFARIEREFGRKLPIGLLFQAPTIRQLAAWLEGPERAFPGSSLVALQRSGSRPPIFFVHGAGSGNLWTYANLAPHLGNDQPVYALESRSMRGLPELTSIVEMATRYLAEIRMIQPTGPYYLGGYCFGGNVAYEIACQLESEGETVALLALLDATPATGSYYRVPWWNPVFAARFARNTIYWISDFLEQNRSDQRAFLVRKIRAFRRRIQRKFSSTKDGDEPLDLETMIDVSLFATDEIDVWKAHLRALRDYHPGPYGGTATLFRTPGQPFLCSLDPKFGWEEFVRGGVIVQPIPGSHEMIFKEPHVSALGKRLRTCLRKAQADNQQTIHLQLTKQA